MTQPRTGCQIQDWTTPFERPALETVNTQVTGAQLEEYESAAFVCRAAAAGVTVLMTSFAHAKVDSVRDRLPNQLLRNFRCPVLCAVRTQFVTGYPGRKTPERW